MKKITTLFMLMIGLSGITTQAVTQATNGDDDLYALVYPSSTGPLSNLYNSDATAQDEIDKFLNNQPSLLDASNPATSGAVGLGTRKLYLYYFNEDDRWPVSSMQSTGNNAYIYYDTTAEEAKIYYNGQTWNGCAITSRPSGELQYKKVLVDSATATAQGWVEMPSTCYYTPDSYTYDTSTAYIKIKTSDENADQGGLCFYGDASLQLGSITISGYKMLTLNDYFLPVYQTSTTTTTEA